MLDIGSGSIVHNDLCNYTCTCFNIFSQKCLITFAWLNETEETTGKASRHGHLFKHPLGFST